MAEHDSKRNDSSLDFAELANNTDELREGLRVMVAGLMADGFTDEQAHHIVACIFLLGRTVSGNPEEGEESA